MWVVTERAEFLSRLAVFEDLTDEELAALARIVEEYSFSRGSVIAYQRDVADCLYIVREGRLFATAVDDNGIVRDSRSYFTGDYFEDRWLFVQEAHPATVKGGSDGRLYIIRGEKFLQFLNTHPGVLNRLAPDVDDDGNVLLGLSEEAWELAQKTRITADRASAAISLLPDELVEFQARRSYYYLLLRVLLPALGLLIVPTAAFILLGAQESTALGGNLRLVVAGLLFVVFLGLTLFQYLDWYNDYFVITNKHLAHKEFSLLTFQSNIIKVPIDQIQSVEIDRPTFLSNLLNFGTARVTTAASVGVVYFDNIDNPGRVQATLNALRQRVRELDAGRVQATMRESLESHFHARPNLVPVKGEDDEETAVTPQPGLSIWQKIYRMYAWRVEDNGIITYRKNLLVLLQQISLPIGFMLAVLFIDWILITFFNFTISSLILGSGLLFIILLGWLIWRAEDWRNDTFQVTDEFVVDIDRKPFGFGESRKQAPLSNVQNVNAIRPNFWATLFRYGHVKIETAGATADITFENVSNPTQIQSDIFRKRDQYRARQRIKEGANRRKEYAVLLDVYKQAIEQERLPRRTPDDADIPGYMDNIPEQEQLDEYE